MLFNLIRSTYSLTSRKYLKQSITLSRHISLFDRLTGRQKNIILYNRENHKVIYRFNYISLVSGIIRAKYYLPIATVFIFPILLIQDSSGALPIAFVIASKSYHFTRFEFFNFKNEGKLFKV